MAVVSFINSFGRRDIVVPEIHNRAGFSKILTESAGIVRKTWFDIADCGKTVCPECTDQGAPATLINSVGLFCQKN